MVATGILMGAAGHRWLAGRTTPSPQALQYVIEYGSMADSRPALSPDGRSVVYARDGAIHVRVLRQLEPVAIPGTEGGTVPFWSPDGAWLGFTTPDFTFAQAPAFSLARPSFALGASGETFIMVRPIERPPGLVVVHDWLALVER